MLVESNRNILIGTVGYHNLCNHSIGPILISNLREMDWPERVTIEEMNWGPIAIVQQFQAMAEPYDRVVLLVAVERPKRSIGELTLFRWTGELPDKTKIQACIGDAVTGVISVENLLVIGEFFQIWPKEVFLLDVEPGPEQAGMELSAELKNRVPEILQAIQRVSLEGTPVIEDWPLFGSDPSWATQNN